MFWIRKPCCVSVTKEPGAHSRPNMCLFGIIVHSREREPVFLHSCRNFSSIFLYFLRKFDTFMRSNCEKMLLKQMKVTFVVIRVVMCRPKAAGGRYCGDAGGVGSWDIRPP